MAVLDKSKLVYSAMLPEFVYRTIGFSSKLYHRANYQCEYETRVSEAYNGYIAPTPSGYVQAGYENRDVYGEPGALVHIDKFIQNGTSWIADEI